MSKAATSRTQEKQTAQTTTEAVLAAARELFLRAGYDGVNLHQVGEGAGVTRQTVYNLFGSKDVVFRAVVDLHWQRIAQDYARAFAFDPLLDAEGVLRHLAAAVIRFVDEQEQIAFTRMVIAESRERPWIAEEFYRLGKQPLMRAFTAALEKLHGEGRLACPEPRMAAHQFLGLIQEFIIWPGVMAIGSDAEAFPSRDRVVDEAVATFLSRYRVTDGRSHPA
jgi:AcrR family transcriptional regulator